MPALAKVLRETRQSAKLTIEAMGALLGLPSETIDALEHGTEHPSASIIREYATLFGSRVEHFLAHGAATSPAALLFRSAAEHGMHLNKELRGSDLRLLGKFLTCVADLHELERLLDLPTPRSIDVEAPDHERPAWEQGRIGAERVRDELGLDDEPISSMIALLADQLRWSVFFVTPDELSLAVQGASTATPQPGILVNLVGGRESWWRTRASLAHEMCHIAFDARMLGKPYLLSPDGDFEARNHWALVEHFRSIERRANSFAAYFLVPSTSLRATIAGISPQSNEAIERICEHFGVGRTMAVRRLGHEFKLSDTVQEEMLRRRTQPRTPEHPDAAIVPSLQNDRLRRLVLEAVERQQLDTIQARSILDLPMSAPLPGLGERGAPLVRPESLARARAEAYAWTLMGPCRSVDAKRTPEGWTVVVEGREERTQVSLSPSFEPIPA